MRIEYRIQVREGERKLSLSRKLLPTHVRKNSRLSRIQASSSSQSKKAYDKNFRKEKVDGRRGWETGYSLTKLKRYWW